MKTTCRWQAVCTAGLGLALAAATGCQTWVGGMTLPTGHYLQHPPQYIPPSPQFPLARELAQQEATAAAGPQGTAPTAALPAPVAPAPAPAPAAPIPGPVPQGGAIQ